MAGGADRNIGYGPLTVKMPAHQVRSDVVYAAPDRQRNVQQVQEICPQILKRTQRIVQDIAHREDTADSLPNIRP